MDDSYPYILCLALEARQLHDCYVAISWCESALGREPEPSDGAVHAWYMNRLFDLLED